MAIIDEFTVNIIVNGQPCQEYEVEPERGCGPKKVTKYIEAISDAPYKISLDMLPSFEFTTSAISFKISIDGQLMGKLLVEPDPRGFRRIISRIDSGAGDNSFSFIDIKRTEGEDPLDAYISDNSLKRIGTILVEVYRYHVPKQTPIRKRGLPTEHYKLLQAQRKIPEEKLTELSLTSLTHSTRLVESESGDGRFWVYGRQTDTSPLAAFEFKYYSSRMLQTLLSMPFELPIRLSGCTLQKPSMEELNIELPIRPSRHPLQKPSMEEPLDVTKIQEPNIQKTLEVSIKEGPGTPVAGKRKRDPRDEGDSEAHTGKSRKCCTAFKPNDLCGEDDQGGKTKTQVHPHPRNPRTYRYQS